MSEYRHSTLQGLFDNISRKCEAEEWYQDDGLQITIGKDVDNDEWVAVVDFENGIEPHDNDDEGGAELYENMTRTLGGPEWLEIYEQPDPFEDL